MLRATTMNENADTSVPTRASWFKTVFSFWTLRATYAAPRGPAGTAILALGLSWLALWVAIDWTERQPVPTLSLDGIALLAWYVLGVLGLAAILRWSSSTSAVSATLTLALGLVPLPLLLMTLIAGTVRPVWFIAAGVGAIIYALLYLGRGMAAVTGRAQPRAALLGVAFIVVFVALSDVTNAIPDLWTPGEVEAGVSDQEIAERETALFEQADRIDQALEKVQRDESPRAEAFFLGFAGVGDEKVFAQEVGLASRVIGERYRTSDRQLSLVNDERDLNGGPLASVSGLDYALHGLASRMKLDRDVLFLAISSHGASDSAIAVSNSEFPLTDLTPQDLADALRDAGIKWRVILVSACYAGGFIEPLRDAQTIVITAAAADRTSFGCSSDSDLTYFGEAFYRDALPEAGSLRDAFEKAKSAIAARESAEGETPSNPQASFGAEIEERLTGISQSRR